MHNHGAEVFGFGRVSFVRWARSRGFGFAKTMWLARYHGWELRVGRLTVEWFRKESKEVMS